MGKIRIIIKIRALLKTSKIISVNLFTPWNNFYLLFPVLLQPIPRGKSAFISVLLNKKMVFRSAHKIISTAEKRLMHDHWPEYYDGVHNKLVGKDARCYQTRTIAGYLVAKTLLTEPEMSNY